MLVRWEAYFRLEPWGEDWLQNARLEAAILNSSMNASEAVSPSELIPNEDNRSDDAEVDAAETHRQLRALAGF